MKKYNIHNFKNHADTTLQMGNLTLLTGINGAGKSSVIQSMLALRETFLRNSNMESFVLQGDSINLGMSSEIVNQNEVKNPDCLQLSITQEDGKTYDFSYSYPLQDMSSLKAKEKILLNDKDAKNIALFTDEFQYLSAFRDGPQVSYAANTDIVDAHHQLSYKNGLGEFTVYFLSQFGDQPLNIEALARDDSRAKTLREQTECWLDVISHGLAMRIDQEGNTYKLKFGYQQKGKVNRFFSALNNGFGITYTLSVIVAILSAKPGTLLLIENPEAHVHPSGQSALMELAAKAAANGVQIVMETHSDHIVNGALVACKMGYLNKEGLSVYYFDKDADFNSKAQKLEIGDNGRLQHTPVGFFDQMDADLEILFDI